ncbi:MAG: hypothetical protein J2O48_03070, partial [Solirubrobacterales bacterium]|nr:hypothetical protein [Solirubrobacterales bacterium]
GLAAKKTTTATTTTAKKTTTTPAKKAAPKPKKPAPSYIGNWTKPWLIQHAVNSDLLPPQMAVTAKGGLGISSGTTDENNTYVAKANLTTGNYSRAKFGSRQVVPGAQQTFGANYRGSSLHLLTGDSPSGASCCSTAGIQTTSGNGQFGTVQPLARGLYGNSAGAMTVVHSGMLATIANQAGIWVSRSNGSKYGTPSQLVGPQTSGPLMAASPLHNGGAVIAWTAPSSGSPPGVGSSPISPTAPTTTSTTSSANAVVNNKPQLIYYSVAPAGTGALPGRPKLAIRVPANKQIDALSIAEHGSGATAAWTESWWSSNGTYASQAYWADLAGGATKAHAISAVSHAATGISIASGGSGRQSLTWQACTSATATCDTAAALRPHGKNWGPTSDLGAVDPQSFPTTAASSDGSLIGWISNGNVYASSAAPTSTTFNPPRLLSKAGDSNGMQIEYANSNTALATWQESYTHPILVGARFNALAKPPAAPKPKTTTTATKTTTTKK